MYNDDNTATQGSGKSELIVIKQKVSVKKTIKKS